MKYIKLTTDNISVIYTLDNSDKIVYEKGFVYPVHHYENDNYNPETDVNEDLLEPDKLYLVKNNTQEILLVEGSKCTDIYDIIIRWLSYGDLLGENNNLLDLDNF